MQNGDVQHVFMMGVKSVDAYGGYETFISKHLLVIISWSADLSRRITMR